MITGDENLFEISKLGNELIAFFEKHGLGSYFKEGNLKKIGRFTHLNSLLKAKNIEPGLFIENLNLIIKEQNINLEGNLKGVQHKLHFVAMLPCGLRNPFKEYMEAHILNNAEKFKDLNYLIEGNVNHELSYYPLLDTIKDEWELPDIIMASDVNNFFHRPFVGRFIKKGIFEAYKPYSPNQYLEKNGYSDPAGNYTMFTANMLVIVVDKNKLGGRKMPEEWDDLLDPDFRNDIIMRGEDNFFCNAVLLPFFKDHGIDVMKILARNIKTGMHPANMVKLAGKNNDEGAAIYIMPYFFAKRVTNTNVSIVWPADGAIMSPVFMLMKKQTARHHKELLNFLFSKATSELLIDRYFPGIHPDVPHDNFNNTAKWLGWEFLNKNDIGALKEEIRNVFMGVWNTKSVNL